MPGLRIHAKAQRMESTLPACASSGSGSSVALRSLTATTEKNNCALATGVKCGAYRPQAVTAHRAKPWLGSRADAATEPTAQQAYHILNQPTERAAVTAEKALDMAVDHRYNIRQERGRENMGKAVKVTITLPDDLLAELDKAAAATNLNRSAYIAVSVTNKMQQDEVLKQMPYIIEKLKENDLKERSSY